MRYNNDRWAFYKIPGRDALSQEEVVYWKNQLAKVVKVGMEFEFNLPEKENGVCKGDSNSCPCKHLSAENDCWKQCVNEERCKSEERNKDICANAKEECKNSECSKCQNFKLACAGIFCPNFVSNCYICEKFETNCNACKYKFDPAKSPEAIRDHLIKTLKPNHTYGEIGESGVHSITTDGSLLGKKGAEIITVGRRVDYWEFFKMARNIIGLAEEKGAYMNERCSIHMHILASYYSKMVPEGSEDRYGVPERVREMERDMPEIILANFHQLVRRYQNAMTWMMMGLNDQERMTRWEKFRVSVLPYSAVLNRMYDVRSSVAQGAGGKKYGWVNYNPVEFNKSTGDIKRFHVEMRACDGLQSPTAVAAIACMYYALVLKAVEISRYGIMDTGDESWAKQTDIVKDAILNGTGGYDGSRFSDTIKLYKYYDLLITESLDLVRQLKSILIKIGPAYEVLERLAERPCAIRLVGGDSWNKIENDLKVVVNEEGIIDIALSEIIVLNQVVECKDEQEWIEATSRLLSENENVKIDANKIKELENNISVILNRKKNDGELVWSQKIGAPLII